MMPCLINHEIQRFGKPSWNTLANALDGMTFMMTIPTSPPVANVSPALQRKHLYAGHTLFPSSHTQSLSFTMNPQSLSVVVDCVLIAYV